MVNCSILARNFIHGILILVLLILLPSGKTVAQCPKGAEIVFSNTNKSCYTNNGSSTASLSINPGTLFYQWSSGQNTQTINNIDQGSYAVTITDQNNCIYTGSTIVSFSEKPEIEWEETFGGTDNERATCINQMPNGNYLVSGHSTSNDGDMSGNNGANDVWVAMVNQTGTLLWSNLYGGSANEYSSASATTVNGEYVIGGQTMSTDGDVTVNNGSADLWVIKLGFTGNLLWEKSFGGPGQEVAGDVKILPNSSLIIAGSSSFVGGDITTNYGSNDFWLIRTDVAGAITWQRSYGSTGNDRAEFVEQTTDGGFVTVGTIGAAGGDVANNYGSIDIWVLITDDIGNIIWEKNYGGSALDRAECIRQTSDGGYIFVGSTTSNDFDVTTNKGSDDLWVVKLGSTGNIQWERTFGGSLQDFGRSVELSDDGGYLITGWTSSNDGDISDASNSGLAFWTMKVSSSGVLLWEKTYGGTLDDLSFYIDQTSDGGLITCGESFSNNGDVGDNSGGSDTWIVKLNNPGNAMSVACNLNNPGTGNNDAEATIVTTGGIEPFNIEWTTPQGGNGGINPATSNEIVSNIGPGFYSVTVTDDNGCQAFCGFNGCGLSVNFNVTNTTCGDPNGSITAVATAGNGGLTYNWSNGQSGATIANLAQGAYTVTVTDTAGCVTTATTVVSFVEPPVLEWEKNYGGDVYDYFTDLIQTKDGNYILVSGSNSTTDDVSTTLLGYDVWITKITPTGSIIWAKTYGSNASDVGYGIVEDADGNFIVAGEVGAASGNVTNHYGGDDVWIFKIDAIGNLIWEQNYGGSAGDQIIGIEATSDGNYLLCSKSSSNNFDLTSNYGSSDYWIVKLDPNGAILWQKSYGGSSVETTQKTKEVKDGYLVLGQTTSSDIDISTNNGNSDIWLIKLDFSGNLVWERNYGGSGNEFGTDLVATDDGGFLIVGQSWSADFDVSNNFGSSDLWVLKIDATGVLQWEKNYGGSNLEVAEKVIKSGDGGYIIVGDSDSNDGDLDPSNNGRKIWVVKIDATGNLIWSKLLGGSSTDYGNEILFTNDGGLLVGGRTFSVNGDVSNNYGASDIWLAKLNAPPPISITKTIGDLACHGDSNGSISVIASNGTPPYAYQWSTGDFTPSIANLAVGVYTVTVTDDNNCTLVDSTTFTQPDSIIISSSLTDPTCGASNGQITINATMGVAPYLYSIDNGTTQVNSNVFNNLSSGTYPLHVEDSNGCSKTSTVTLTNISGPTIDSFQITDEICGFDNGSITIFASGVPPLGYSNDNGATFQSSNTFFNLTSGSYPVVVRDGNACISNQTVLIGNFSSPVITTVTTVDPSCGATNGSLSISHTGGFNPVQFSIDNGNTLFNNNTFSNLAAATYSIVIIDANGCKDDTLVTLTPLSAPVIDTTIFDNALCGGANGFISIMASGGTPPLQYSFDNGTTLSSNSVFSGLIAGTYDIYVVDVNNCTVSDQVILADFNPMVIDSVQTLASQCGGSTGSITVFASNPSTGFFYSIDNGVTFVSTNVFNNLSSGSYQVVTEDNFGCTASATAVVGGISGPVIDTTIVGNSLCGGPSGFISIIASGGAPPLQYSIDNGTTLSSNSVFSGLIAGTYDIYVVDTNNCAVSDQVVLGDNNPLVIDSVQTQASLCGGSSGSITIFASGSGTAVSYSIDNGISFFGSNVFDNLASGGYQVVVQDNDGCTASATAVVSGISGPVIDSLTTVNPSCGAANGSLTIFHKGGNPPVEFSIDNGATYVANNVFSNLAAATYSILIKDTNSCTDDTIVSLTNLAAPVIDSVTTVDPLCGIANGSIEIHSSGGSGTIQYSIDNGTTLSGNSLFSNLNDGTFDIYVVDANNCIVTTQVILAPNASPVIDSVTTIEATCGATNGSITIFASGAGSPFQYSIDNGTTYQSNSLFQNLGANTYQLVVEDSNGCQGTSTVSISNSNGPIITNVVSVNPTCGALNGSITINATGGSAPIEFSIDNGVNYSTTNVFSGLDDGIYTIIVKDVNNCQTSVLDTLIDLGAPTLDSLAVTNALCTNDNGEISIYVSGGTPPLQYSIDNGITFQSSNAFSALNSGTYQIVVIDANSCTVTANSTIAYFPPPSFAFLQGITDTYCGLSIGEISITAIGGTPPLQYSIDGGVTYQSGNNFQNLGAGPYTLTVQDNNGCIITKNDSIQDLPGPTVSVVSTSPPACNMTTGSITVQSVNGLAPYTYTINAGAPTVNPVFSNLPQGIHEIIVSDFNGCADTINVTLTDIPAPVISQVLTSDPTCGQSNATIAITASGTAPLQYSIDNGSTYQSSNTFNNLSSGTYDIVVTDANGCMTTAQETLLNSGAPVINSLIIADAACGQNSGSVTVNATGGLAPLLYSLDGVNYQVSNLISNLSAGAYTIFIFDANNCQTDTTITINDLSGPQLDTILATDPNCNMNDGIIVITAINGTTPYEYSIDNGGSFQLSNTFSGLVPGLYNIVVKDANGCTVMGAAQLTNQNGPVITGMNSTMTFCDTSSGSLEVVAQGGNPPYQYNWNTVPTQTNPLATGLPAGTYIVTVTDAIGCTDVASGMVEDPVQFPVDLGPDQSICNQAWVTLGTGLTGNTFEWSTGATTPTITVNTPGQYNLTITDSNNCVSSDSVTVFQTTFLPTISNDTVILRGDEAELLATGGANYDWWPTTGLDCANCPNPIASPFDSTRYYVAISDGQCTDTLSVQVGVVGSRDTLVVIPPVITPGGDGINDVFVIAGIEAYPNNRVTIINRWGDVVHQSFPYKNDWDGTHNGKPLPQGTYYYLVELDVNVVTPRKGSITIVR